MDLRKKTVVKNLILLAVVLLVAAGIALHIRLSRAPDMSGKERSAIDRNVAYLEGRAQDANINFHPTGERLPLRAFSAEKKYVLSMELPARETLVARFSGTAIVGDSMIDAIAAYGILDDSVIFSKIGASVSTAGEVLASMEAARPYAVFLCFGLNDMDLYGDKVDRFIKDYAACVKTLHEKVPFADVYICALSPVTEEAVQKTPAYKNIALYNREMKKMCEKTDAVFLDPSFILESRPDLFDQDGIHPKKAFYPRFLTFLADMAGLENE